MGRWGENAPGPGPTLEGAPDRGVHFSGVIGNAVVRDAWILWMSVLVRSLAAAGGRVWVESWATATGTSAEPCLLLVNVCCQPWGFVVIGSVCHYQNLPFARDSTKRKAVSPWSLQFNPKGTGRSGRQLLLPSCMPMAQYSPLVRTPTLISGKHSRYWSILSKKSWFRVSSRMFLASISTAGFPAESKSR